MVELKAPTREVAEDDYEAEDRDRAAGGGLAGVEASARAQSLLITGARTLSALLTIAIPYVLVRVLDQTTFGHYKQLFLVAGTAVSLLSLGLPGSLYYFVPRHPDRSQQFHVQTALMLGLLGLLGAGAIVVGRDPLSDFFDAPLHAYLGWIALYTALSVPASLLVASPMVDRRARLVALLLSGFDLFRSALIVTVALVWRELTPILVAVCLLMALQCLAIVVYLAWRRDGGEWLPSVAGLRTQLAYALPFTGAAMIGMAQMQLHAYYVAASFSAAQFAIYSVATLNIPLIGQFSRTVGEVVILENTKHHAAGDHAEMRRVWHRATHVLGLALLPIWIVMEVFAPDVILFMFGEPYMAATPLFRVYLLMLPLSLFMGSQMLRATGDLRLMMGADSISLLITILFLVALGPRLGAMAAVASLILGRAAFMLLASGRTARRMDVGIRDFLPWGSLAAMLTLAIAAAVPSRLAVEGLDLPVLARLFVGGGVATGLYALVALSTGLVPEPEKRMVRRRLLSVAAWLRRGPGSEASL